MDIPNIGVRNIKIPTQGIPRAGVWEITPPIVNFIDVPVVVDIGSPIVNMPGCVESHPDGGPQLAKDDPKGTKILCTNEYPSYNAMDYSPEDLVYTKEEEPPPVAPTPEVPEGRLWGLEISACSIGRDHWDDRPQWPIPSSSLPARRERLWPCWRAARPAASPPDFGSMD